MSAATSLIDVAITLGITAVLAAGTVPKIGAAAAHRMVRHELSKLRLEAERAHTAAVITGYPVHLVIDHRRIVVINTEGQIAAESGIDERVEITPPDAAITFYPSGAASPSTITVSAQSSKCSLVVSLRARSRTECA